MLCSPGKDVSYIRAESKCCLFPPLIHLVGYSALLKAVTVSTTHDVC